MRSRFVLDRWAPLRVAAIAVATVALVAGCGDDRDVDDAGVSATAGDSVHPGTTDDVTPSVEAGQENYFTGDAHVGERVTITGRVVAEPSAGAAVFDAAAYGDDSLLVLVREDARQLLESAGEITVTGTVERFSYADYAERYGLVDAARYDAFEQEAFLLADHLVPISGPTS